MPDVFISYSTRDEKLAQSVYERLQSEGISVFLASVSLRPGEHWPSGIIGNLRSSQWVILLASKAACQSPFVQQEMGGAVLGDKKIIPIVWDMPPDELPGWISDYQAIDLRGATIGQLAVKVVEIADDIKAEKAKGLLILGAIVLVYFMLKGSPEQGISPS